MSQQESAFAYIMWTKTYTPRLGTHAADKVLHHITIGDGTMYQSST